MKKSISLVFTLVMMVMMVQVCRLSMMASAQIGNEVDVAVNDQIKNIVDYVKTEDNFETFVTLIEASGIVETLNAEGPFTVFVPTDEAFAKLPTGTVEDLLKPENKEKLCNILMYHVLPTKVLSPDVIRLGNKEIKMMNSVKAKIMIENKEVSIAGAKIIMADVMLENGIVHVIDNMMMPEQ